MFSTLLCGGSAVGWPWWLSLRWRIVDPLTQESFLFAVCAFWWGWDEVALGWVLWARNCFCIWFLLMLYEWVWSGLECGSDRVYRGLLWLVKVMELKVTTLGRVRYIEILEDVSMGVPEKEASIRLFVSRG